VNQDRRTNDASYTAANERYDTNAFGATAMAKWFFFNSDRISLFTASGLGGFFAGRKVPANNGSPSSATFNQDVGANLSLFEGLSLEAAGRYNRIGFSGQGLNAWGGNLGLKWAF